MEIIEDQTKKIIDTDLRTLLNKLFKNHVPTPFASNALFSAEYVSILCVYYKLPRHNESVGS